MLSWPCYCWDIPGVVVWDFRSFPVDLRDSFGPIQSQRLLQCEQWPKALLVIQQFALLLLLFFVDSAD